MIGERVVSEAEWDEAQARNARYRWLSAAVGMVALAALSIPAMALGARTGSGVLRYVESAGILLVLMSPILWVLVRTTAREQQRTDEKIRALTHELADALAVADREAADREVQVRRQRFESRLANALDMAEGEPEVIDVIERSFAAVVPGAPVELLLADNSHAHLLRMASASPTGSPPGCAVDSPDHCPAARRAQVQRFGDSDELDACPKLRNRSEARLSALCVPVSIMGRTVGVIHATGAPDELVDDARVEDLGTLAKLAGARIGLLRVMAETQLQASTDSLTGLLNRRSFDVRMSAMRRVDPVVAVAMADLDRFKELNDTYGHETGDRALRVFAQVLRDAVRADDVISRHGGEEFIIAFPSCTASQASDALAAARVRLDAALTVAGLPRFTVSFGVVDAVPAEDLALLTARADAALFEAKRRGRDQIVVHDGRARTVEPGDAPADAVAALSRELR